MFSVYRAVHRDSVPASPSGIATTSSPATCRDATAPELGVAWPFEEFSASIVATPASHVFGAGVREDVA
jgi:hypothetical protein